MLRALSPLLKPMTLTGITALLAVGWMVQYMRPEIRDAAWLLLTIFFALFLAQIAFPQRQAWLVLPMPFLALGLIWLDPSPGVAPVLLVVWSASATRVWRWQYVLLSMIAANLAFYLIMLAVSDSDLPLLKVLLNASFQMFGALCVHYANTAERARDALALVNVDLLATRALLADSARDAERLRVARELHDVAGHKLTAMKLNLRALAADPALAARGEVRIAQQLSSELLDDIRQVVQTLRDARGLDLHTALHALAAPMPKPRLQLDIASDATTQDPAIAETLLRVVQEALTNAARHANADTLFVRLAREGGTLLLQIEDDGQRSPRLCEGNGLSGMRERIGAAGGSLTLDTGPQGALRIAARIPA